MNNSVAKKLRKQAQQPQKEHAQVVQELSPKGETLDYRGLKKAYKPMPNARKLITL